MKKKILFAIPTLGGGGAERVLVTLLNNLNKNKYDITLFCLFDGGVNKNYLNNDIHYNFFFKKVFRGNIHLLKMFTPERLYKIMIKEDYDIVISYLEGPVTRIVSGCRNPSTKLLNWIHIEIDNPKVIYNSFRNAKEAIDSYKKFDATVFVSESARNSFKETFKEINGTMLVKYNTVDTQQIVSKSEEKIEDLELNRNKVNLVSVGRFTQQKGYFRLLETVRLLINKKPNVHLYLLGKGDLEDRYREFINKNDLSKHVTILGFKNNPYKYVKNADLFVCSSYQEGYSTAVTESLIVGTPVVTTLCSGMKELLGENNEYGLITENDDDELYKGIERMIYEPGLLDYYKQQAVQRGSYFNTEKTVNSVENLLDSL